MKPIVVLVAIVALSKVVDGAIQTEGALRGPWFDRLSITSTLDTAAPQVGYDGIALFHDTYPDGTIDVSDWGAGFSESFNCFFAITNENERWRSFGGGVELTFVGGANLNQPDNTITTTCTISSGNSVSCTGQLHAHSGAFTYQPRLTVWDQFGNSRTYDSNPFDDPERPATLTVFDSNTDATPPVLSDRVVSVTEVALPAGPAVGDYGYLDVSVRSYDHVGDGDDYDEDASGVVGVWVVVAGEDAVEWKQPLIRAEIDSNGVETWGIRFAFASWAELDVWTIVRFESVDGAGNLAIPLDGAATVSIVRSADHLDDDVSGCHSLEFNVQSNLTVDAPVGYAYANFLLECTEKFTGKNYAYISFRSPEYTPDGENQRSALIVGTTGYSGIGTSFVTAALGSTPEAMSPGLEMDNGVTAPNVRVFPGSPGASIGSWTLYEVVTVSATGAARRYTAELDGGSTALPSRFVVAIVVAVALFRL